MKAIERNHTPRACIRKRFPSIRLGRAQSGPRCRLSTSTAELNDILDAHGYWRNALKTPLFARADVLFVKRSFNFDCDLCPEKYLAEENTGRCVSCGGLCIDV